MRGLEVANMVQVNVYFITPEKEEQCGIMGEDAFLIDSLDETFPWSRNSDAKGADALKGYVEQYPSLCLKTKSSMAKPSWRRS